MFGLLSEVKIPFKPAVSLSVSKAALVATFSKPLDWLGKTYLHMSESHSEGKDTVTVTVPAEHLRGAIADYTKDLATETASRLFPLFE